MKQLSSFIRKEFRHIFRDIPTMLILFILPVVMMFLFGYALSTEIKHSSLGIVNLSNDAFAQQFIEKISHSEFFSFSKQYSNQKEIMAAFRNGDIKIAVIIPQNFYEDLINSKKSTILVIADASDPNSARTLVNYTEQIANNVLLQEKTFSNNTSNQNLVSLNLLYNPQMKSSYSLVPAVMGFILTLVCAMMTSVSIVREKERGNMELLLVSPVKTTTIIIAKLAPYFLLSVVNFVTILLVGHFIMKVPVNGSLFWIVVLSILYTVTSLSFGLLVSTIVKTQLAALLVTGLIYMMPSLILSGMMFPIENMPWLLRIIAIFTPARWFIGAIRKLMIMGVDVRHVAKEMTVLVCIMFTLLVVSIKGFKQRLL
ncbi:MAG: ABC transporter permease [Bacteroidales bacterium]|jgi:ABC-2 type transport system permease protein|nr:ABC transporter permease [Bacteroidales bacterium]